MTQRLNTDCISVFEIFRLVNSPKMFLFYKLLLKYNMIDECNVHK